MDGAAAKSLTGPELEGPVDGDRLFHAIPAGSVATIGWTGALNVRPATQVSAVLRSWEDRFRAIVVGLGFATMTLLVTSLRWQPRTASTWRLRSQPSVPMRCGSRGQWPYEKSDASLEALIGRLLREPVWRLRFD